MSKCACQLIQHPAKIGAAGRKLAMGMIAERLGVCPVMKRTDPGRFCINHIEVVQDKGIVFILSVMSVTRIYLLGN